MSNNDMMSSNSLERKSDFESLTLTFQVSQTNSISVSLSQREKDNSNLVKHQQLQSDIFLRDMQREKRKNITKQIMKNVLGNYN